MNVDEAIAEIKEEREFRARMGIPPCIYSEVLVAEIEGLRSVLRQYADAGNWASGDASNALCLWAGPGDGPDLAREALEGKP